MTRFKYIWGVAGLAALVSVVALVVSAAPAGATLVCPKGVTNPKYCTNVPPVASTGKASPVQSQGATLNGTSGPGVPGGDVTSYFFQWGLSTTYGKQTPTGTVGSCPPGIGKPTYCPGVPATEHVSADIGGLQPCQVYHFRIVSINPDGGTNGADASFTTTFGKTLENVKVPKRVKHGHKFKVKFTLVFRASVKIFIIRRQHHTVKTYDLGSLRAGKHSKKINGLKKKGKYTVRFVARESCGKQVVNKTLHVH